MKRLLLLACLCCLFHALAQAATIGGAVVYSGTSHAAAGHKIYLVDSSASTGSIIYRDSLIIPTSGSYSFTIPSTITSGLFRTYLFSCGTSASSGYNTYSGSNLTINLSLGCPVPQVVDTIKNATTGAPVFGRMIYLMDSNASFYYLDSQFSAPNGYVDFIIPPTIITDTLRIFTISPCGTQSQSFWFNNSFMSAPPLNVCYGNPVVSGTLSNIASSAPISGYKVCLVDSVGATLVLRDSVYTNSSGSYSFTIPGFTTTGNMTVYTQACGTRVANTGAFSGSSLSLNLSACATSTASLSGQLTNSTTSAAIAGQKIYFTDSISSTSIYRDSAFSGAGGMYTFNIPATMNTGYCSIFTQSCSNNRSSAYYSGSNLTLNLAVYPGTPNSFSGIIYETNGTPASNVQVSIYLYGVSSTPASVTAITNSLGVYNIAIPCNWPIPATILMYTYRFTNGCGAVSHFQGANNYTGSNIVLSDTLCPVITWTLGGTVSRQGGGVASNAKVYLISETYDTSTVPFHANLMVYDSTLTNSTGQYLFVNAQAYGVMHIKAALQSSDPNYWSFLPTYRDSSLLWSGADSIDIFKIGTHSTTVNVSLRGGVNPGGPGFIGGNVLLGANKSSAVGDPLSHRVILLTTAAGKAVSYAYSDLSGRFSFSNLPYGSYKLFGDAWGKGNPALDITLSAQNPAAGNVVFEENSSSFKGHLNTLSVQNASALSSLAVFPNPATDYVEISGLKGDATITLRDVSGKIIPASPQFRGGLVYIPSSHLAAGLYFLQVHSGAGITNLRFTKQ